MIHFSERKELNDRLEEQLSLWKQEYEQPEMSKEQYEKLRARMKEAKRDRRREQRKRAAARYTAAAAVFLAAFIVVPNMSAEAADAMGKLPVIGQFVEAVTFRNYTYESERNMADIRVPELKLEGQPDSEGQSGSKVQADEKAQTDNGVQEKLKRTTEEINAEIRKITDELVEEFEANLEFEGGYQDVVVDSQVLTATEDYFTLKLCCYQGAGSGYAWNYYYTIDLNTGERLMLEDVFKEGADYITPISENIKEQMRAQMQADENVVYWLDNEIEEWNFKKIAKDAAFYLNGEDNVVICYNEGDVAPMYMGTVEFEIPAEVLGGIRK
ncbi:MAG: RsiV family protein [Eubacterium sp.]|nr:RsiV family protein [Eubacterium sp.]